MRRLFVGFVLSLGLSLLVTAMVRLRELHRTWGVHPDDAARDLPGDDLVAPASVVDTRSLEIDAPPAEVWPWVVQMGYGRGGWYSYDRMDMRGASADRILPEFQELAKGDILPTWPGGGFRIETVDPGRALVLYLDTPLVASQAKAAATARATGGTVGSVPPGLQAAGAMGGATMPEFRASWAIVLEPLGERRTRLVERFRVWTPLPTPAQRMGLPFMGYGVFLMTRKHMLGLKERAERGGSPLSAGGSFSGDGARGEAPVGA